MTASKGYYSLIQYCPDLGRLEAANVGVLLFCPDRGFLKAKTSRNNKRIIAFFGTANHDWERINSFKKGLEERLSLEGQDIRSVSDLEHFIRLRANLLQITPPRPMKVSDPEKDLASLFSEITGEPVGHTQRTSLRKQLEDTILKAGLGDKMRHNIPIEVPINKKKLEVPLVPRPD